MKKANKSLLKKAGAVAVCGLVGAGVGGVAVFSQMDDNYDNGVIDGKKVVMEEVNELQDKLDESKAGNLLLKEEKEELKSKLDNAKERLDEFDEVISDAVREDVALAMAKEHIESDKDFSDDLEDALSHEVEKVLSVELVNAEVDVDEESGDLEAEVEGSLVVRYEDKDENVRVEVLDVEFEIDGEVEGHSLS